MLQRGFQDEDVSIEDLSVRDLQNRIAVKTKHITAECCFGVRHAHGQSLSQLLHESSIISAQCEVFFIALRERLLAVRAQNQIFVLDLEETAQGHSSCSVVKASFDYDPGEYHFFKDDIPSPKHRGQIKRWAFANDTTLVAVTKFFGVYSYSIETGLNQCLKPETLPDSSSTPLSDLYTAARFGELTACDSRDSLLAFGGNRMRITTRC
eukprot:Selendium_serpulae@DN5851_c0_g1_i6.p1